MAALLSALMVAKNGRWHLLRACGLALLLTLLATVGGMFLEKIAHPGNLALIYMAAVVITAVYTSTLPALLSAFSSFFAFNLFFTEPRGTLLITDQEDALTAALLLLIALLVGPLAARFQVKVRTLEFKEISARIELQLLERMSTAIHPDEIMAALQSALRELTGVACEVTRESRPGVFFSAQVLEQTPTVLIKALADDESLLATARIPLPLEPVREAALPSVDILLRQSGLALGRTRLLTDLAQERMEKEQELLRSSLLSSVSHDFRTPLTAMIGATTTLMEMGEALTREQQHELLESVLSEAERLNNYTQNLLDMTRLGRGELKLERSWVSIEEIIHVTLKRLRPLAEFHHLDINIAASLPLLRVHPALIEQAIFNVLHNALKFSPPDSVVTLRCYESSSAAGRVLALEIMDEGPGIEESEREKVFRMFHTAEKGDRRAAGSGLGLAICKGMIGAHGGSVEIADGSNGAGCLVRMTIPVAEQDDSSAEERDEHDTGD